MKRIKCLESFAGDDFAGSPGAEIIVRDEVAADLVRCKYATVLGDAPEPKAAPKQAETAEAEKPEAQTATASEPVVGKAKPPITTGSVKKK